MFLAFFFLQGQPTNSMGSELTSDNSKLHGHTNEHVHSSKVHIKRLTGAFTGKTEVLEMRFTAYFWTKCSHYQWHFLHLDFSVLKRRVTILFIRQ